MQHFLAVFFPPFMLTVLVVGLLILTGYLVAARVRLMAARRRQAVSETRANEALTADRRDATAAAFDAIASVIAELQSRPATYQTFPDDVRNALYVAHEKSHLLPERRSR